MDSLRRHGCHECQGCGLVVCLPLPTDPGSQYGAEYFDRRGEQDARDIRAKVEAFRELARDIRKLLGPGARVFEVGSAVGALLRALEDEGVLATGLELSAAAVASGRRDLGVDLALGSVDTTEFPDRVDAVVALHVIEHLRSPRTVVEKARGALRAGGFLVLEVPDFGAPMREQCGEEWPYFRPGEHLYHFTEASLAAMLSRCGFAVRRVQRYGGFGVLAGARPAPELRDLPPLARLLFASRSFAYTVPGAKRALRWVNERIGYNLLRRHAHLRVWAERVS